MGLEAAGAKGLRWALLCVFLTSGLSLLYLYSLTRSGKVRDPRSIPRAERVGPLRAVAALHAGAFAIVYGLGGPAELSAALLSYAIATVLFAALTPIMNLSLHAAGVAGTAVCLVFVFGAWGVPSFLLLPAVSWARLRLKRHTVPELVLGALVGGGGTWISFTLLA